MDISDVYAQNNPNFCKWSPNGQYLSTTVGKNQLVVRDTDTLKIVHIFSCVDEIQDVEWSTDSNYILCAIFKKNIVQIWNMTSPEWRCKIDEGSSGLEATHFVPSSTQVLTLCDFQNKLNVWSFENHGSVICTILNPKGNISFSHSKRYAAIARRSQCKDSVSVYDCNDRWELVRDIQVTTMDLDDILWSLDDRLICVKDLSLRYCIQFYSALDGRCLFQYQAYDNALGIKSLSWSNENSNANNYLSHYIAVGSYDQKIRIIDSLTWKVITELVHTPQIHPGSAIVYREIEDETDPYQPRKYTLDDSLIALSQVKLAPDQPNPKLGVGLIQWSTDNRYIVSRNDNMPTILWIWEIASSIQLISVVIQKEPIRVVKWDPLQSRLAFTSGTSSLYIWTPSGAISVQIPMTSRTDSFLIHNLQWNSDGTSLVVADKSRFCVCYLPDFQQAAEEE